MRERAGDFTLRIYVTPPEDLADDAVPTRPFHKQAINQIVSREQRVANAARHRERARKLLMRFGFGLPETRNSLY